MGVYAVTGGSSGIGAKTVEMLRAKGNQVINIDLKGGDICANLATVEGRNEVIRQLHVMAPDGLDGLVCNAGVSGACGNLPLIVSLNYFGVTKLAKGVRDLLIKKGGRLSVTSSNTISQGTGRQDIADLLNNVGDEKMICDIVAGMDPKNVTVGNSIYVATKYALARWVRRVAPYWAARGVRVNAVAPGNVRTAMTGALEGGARAAVNALPIPTKYGGDALMEPDEIAGVIVFLVSEESLGMNGNVVFVDGGTDALLNSEKVY